VTVTGLPAPPYQMRRLGILMTPDPGDHREAWGVLNPACARGRDGELYLFPRLVAEGNLSRIGRARVHYEGGVPVGIERLGVVLEPDEAWERNTHTAGVEDPRITFLPLLDSYVMTYSAYGPLGPRIGLAVSRDAISWERLGPTRFDYDPALRTDMNLYSNKDAVLFPEPVVDPNGNRAYALLHRPTWDLSWITGGGAVPLPHGVNEARPGIWVSYADADAVERDLSELVNWHGHRQVALPEQPWEALKIGAGTPPVRTSDGWLMIYHGVDGHLVPGRDLQPTVFYSAGVMMLDPDDVSRVAARSHAPVLQPDEAGEREGIVPNVVFPTAIATREDDDDYDVFYGMADSRIGAARLTRTGPVGTPG
jgi:beta-1,2-mannobiose phosphorylase / 1,2-beta-oligomannan phosphorylase